MPADKDNVKEPEVATPAAQEEKCSEQEKNSCGCGCIMPPLEKKSENK